MLKVPGQCRGEARPYPEEHVLLSLSPAATWEYAVYKEARNLDFYMKTPNF